MKLRIACQMDPIDRIDIRGDSTFALLLEAQRRGHELFYYTPYDLALNAGRLIARGHAVTVEDRVGGHFRLGERQIENLADWQVVMLRQDPPFDMAYITTTHLLAGKRFFWPLLTSNRFKQLVRPLKHSQFRHFVRSGLLPSTTTVRKSDSLWLWEAPLQATRRNIVRSTRFVITGCLWNAVRGGSKLQTNDL